MSDPVKLLRSWLKQRTVLDTKDPLVKETLQQLTVEIARQDAVIKELKVELGKGMDLLVRTGGGDIPKLKDEITRQDEVIKKLGDGTWWDGNEPYTVERMESFAKAYRNKTG